MPNPFAQKANETPADPPTTATETSVPLELTSASESESAPEEAPAPEQPEPADPNQTELPIETQAAPAVLAEPASTPVTDEQAVPSLPGATAESVIYSCHPLRNLRLGRFQFNDSIMVLNGREIQLFDRLHAGQPSQIRNSIVKIDVEAAHALVRRKFGTSMHQGVDTSDRGPKADPRA